MLPIGNSIIVDPQRAARGGCLGLECWNKRCAASILWQVRWSGSQQHPEWLRPCNEGQNIRWKWDTFQSFQDRFGTGRGNYVEHKMVLMAAGEKFCLDVKDHKFANGTPLQIWKCLYRNKDQNVNAKTVDKEKGFITVEWKQHPEFYLDVKDGQPNLWQPVQIWTKGPNQIFGAWDDNLSSLKSIAWLSQQVSQFPSVSLLAVITPSQLLWRWTCAEWSRIGRKNPGHAHMSACFNPNCHRNEHCTVRAWRRG